MLADPTLTFALAMTVGVVAQGLARHMSVPGVVVLLAVGVLLGPDVADVIRPHTMGSALSAVVGFAVAVILFEGGLNLEIRALRGQAKTIRRLVLFGGIITAVGATLACRLLLGWDWRLSVLFGTLVIVTGPTVITPLVRRIRLKPHIGTILEAEGIFIDAIGATIAVVALQVAIAPSGEALGAAVFGILTRLGVGALVGSLGGMLLALLLMRRNVVPHGLESILSLTTAMLLYQLSDGLMPESGITAAIAAGMVLGNGRSHALPAIANFKEQLTVLLIATLFVLLAADIRIDDVLALGLPGVYTVLALMFIVRPITVFACTIGAGLGLREKLFLAWLAPRGIVAAAVSTLFAMELAHAGIAGGVELRSLVFLVIAMTVTIQGLSGTLAARLLGVRRAKNSGYLVLGANALARHLATRLGEGGEEVILVDTNPDECRLATDAGHHVVRGDGLDPATLGRLHPEQRIACIAVTANEAVNLEFARKLADDAPHLPTYVAIDADTFGVTVAAVRTQGSRVLFGGAQQLQGWFAHWHRDGVITLRCTRGDITAGTDALASLPRDEILPIMLERDGALILIDPTLRLAPDDIIEFAIDGERRERALARLANVGWTPVEDKPDETPE